MTEDGRITITEAAGAADMDAVRVLFREYQEWAGDCHCFVDFEEELGTLPGRYAPPQGRLLLARDGDAVAGGVAMWPLDEGACEMKRLYVRPSWRRLGLGRRLADTLIAAATDAGYARMGLETLTRMGEAQALYRSMGFTLTGPWHDTPDAASVFMGLEL